MSYTRDQLNETAKQYEEIEDLITDAEWESICLQDGKTPRFSEVTALTRIMNVRKGLNKKVVDETKEVITAVYLGSDDITSKKFDLKDSPGVYMMLLVEGPNGPELEVGAKFGKVKVDPGTRCQMEVRRSKQTLDDGRVRHNLNVGKITAMDSGHIRTPDDFAKVGIPILGTDDIKEHMKYQPVAVKGEIYSLDPEPRWIDGEPDEDNPYSLFHDTHPAFIAHLRTQGTVCPKLGIHPRRMGRALMAFPDLNEILKDNNLDDAATCMVRRHVLAIGTLRRYSAGEKVWVDIDTFSFFEIPRNWTPPTNGTVPAPVAVPQTATTSPPVAQPQAAASVSSAAPSAAAGRIARLKGAVAEAYEILGSDITVDGLLDLGLLDENEVKKIVIARLIVKEMKDKGHEVLLDQVLATA